VSVASYFSGKVSRIPLLLINSADPAAIPCRIPSLASIFAYFAFSIFHFSFFIEARLNSGGGGGNDEWRIKNGEWRM
jgi:hypothetical protein